MTPGAAEMESGLRGAGPHDDPAVWGPRLERLVAEQCALGHELDKLGERQRELIGSGDSDGLLRLLAERQCIVDRMTGLGAQVEPFRRQWETVMARLPGQGRASMERLVEELAAVIDRVCRRDDADRAILESRRTAVAGDLSGLGRARGAMAAYDAPRRANPGPAFQDREG